MVYDCVVVWLDFEDRNIYYRNGMFMNNWIKCKDKSPDLGRFTGGTSVRVTDDDIIHLIRILKLNQDHVLSLKVKPEKQAADMHLFVFVANNVRCSVGAM